MAGVAPMALITPACMHTVASIALEKLPHIYATYLLHHVYPPDMPDVNIGCVRSAVCTWLAGTGGWPEGVCTGTTLGVPGACRCGETIECTFNGMCKSSQSSQNCMVV